MKNTVSITIVLNNRFHDVERVIGLFSATGYKIAKLNLSGADAEGLSKLVVVTDTTAKNLKNFLTRLRQQVRVVSVESVSGDKLPDHQMELTTL